MEPWAVDTDVMDDFLFDLFEGDIYPNGMRFTGLAGVAFDRYVYQDTVGYPDGVLPKTSQ